MLPMCWHNLHNGESKTQMRHIYVNDFFNMWRNVSKKLCCVAFLHCFMHKDTFVVNMIHLHIRDFNNIGLKIKVVYCDTTLAATTSAFPFLPC